MNVRWEFTTPDGPVEIDPDDPDGTSLENCLQISAAYALDGVVVRFRRKP